MAAPQPPAEFYQQVPLRPGESLLGFLPNVLSVSIPIQGGRGLRRDELGSAGMEQPTDVVGTTERLIGYRFSTEKTSAITQKRFFRVRFVAPLEHIQEVRVMDLRVNFMAELAGGGLHTVYLVTGGSTEAQGVSRWLAAICQQRRVALGMAQEVGTGEIRTGGRTAAIRNAQDSESFR